MVRSYSKVLLIVTACAMVATSCTKASSIKPITTGGGSYGSGVALPTNAPTLAPAAQAAGSNARPSSGGSYGGYKPPPGYKPYTGGQGSGDFSATPNDSSTLGQMAYWYLNRAVPKLTIEIHAVPGFAPSAQTLNMLHQRLASVADKPGGIEILPTVSDVSGKSVWSIQDAADVESRDRTHHSSMSDATMYLLFVNGKADSGALGTAYNASSDILFEQSIRGASDGVVTAQEIEQSAVIHEVGHILSLVNEGYTSPRPHEDSQHPGHSNDPKSVMYWVIDNVGVATLLGGRTVPPNDYDSDDRADLNDVRNKKLIPH